MSGHYRRPGRIRQELVEKSVFGILDFAPDRQTKTEQAVIKAPLGGFELRPGDLVPVDAQVRNDPRQPAGGTQRVRIIAWNGPVANVVVDVVLAKAIVAAGRRLPFFVPQQG